MFVRERERERERERRFLFYCAYFSIMFICFLFLKMNCYVDSGLLTYDWNIIQQLIMISLFLSHLSSKLGLCDFFYFFLIGKLHTNLVGFEHTTSPSRNYSFLPFIHVWCRHQIRPINAN